jgi:hypothetical protein
MLLESKVLCLYTTDRPVSMYTTNAFKSRFMNKRRLGLNKAPKMTFTLKLGQQTSER